MNKNERQKPVFLCILDGWGIGAKEHNAITSANTPNLDNIEKKYPQSILETSGLDVGLPKGQMGNSEVGHMNIGSGRIIMQSLPKIDTAIENGSLKSLPDIKELITKLKEAGGKAHLVGLVSDGGVHSHINHIVALAKILSKEGIGVNIHAFLDGRDTPPESGKGYMKELEKEISGDGNIKICTIAGRYYPMDRDNRWERIEKGYDAIVLGEGEKIDNITASIEKSYEAGVDDEFVIPLVVADYNGIQDGDALLMANFRSDRVRQILTALLDPNFKGFERKRTVDFSYAVGMVEYSDDLNNFIHALFPSESLNNILGQVLSENGLTQLRIAETEKYAHVTFFFNGGKEGEFSGEDRILVPSPKVSTYDLQPEMSAPQVTEKLVEAINSGKYDFIVANYANTDMVGHTGDEESAKKAVEAIDSALGKLVEAIMEKKGVMLITADHGNAEQMVDPGTGKPHTAHTTNPVPFIAIGVEEDIILKDGRLCDIAPTILKIMNLKKPDEIVGKSLISS